MGRGKVLPVAEGGSDPNQRHSHSKKRRSGRKVGEVAFLFCIGSLKWARRCLKQERWWCAGLAVRVSLAEDGWSGMVENSWDDGSREPVESKYTR